MMPRQQDGTGGMGDGSHTHANSNTDNAFAQLSAGYGNTGGNRQQAVNSLQQQQQQPQQQQLQQQGYYAEDLMLQQQQQQQQQQQRFMGGAGQAGMGQSSMVPNQGFYATGGANTAMNSMTAAGQAIYGAAGATGGGDISPQIGRMTTGGVQHPYNNAQAAAHQHHHTHHGMYQSTATTHPSVAAAGGYYGAVPAPGMTNSPNFPPSGMDDPLGQHAGGRGGTMHQASGGAGGTSAAGGVVPQDREEELLLQLLIARRQRGGGHVSGGNEAENSGAGSAGRNSQILADELMRLRQGRASHGSLPGMPPIYDATPNMAAPSDAERIDRSPRIMDARTQGDFHGRKRQAYTDAHGNIKYHNVDMGMDGMDVPLTQATKKKRSHKKKPADMPRRPLSAYNLFFSEERGRILKEIDGKDDKEGEGEADAAKKETKDSADGEDKETDEVKKEGEEGGEDTKPQALLRPMIPSQKKRRPHRKTHGKISFQQLARMVGERWKSLPDDRRKYYQGLAQEDMKRQKTAMEAYYIKQNETKVAEINNQEKAPGIGEM